MKEVCPAQIDFGQRRFTIEGVRGTTIEVTNVIKCDRKKCPLNTKEPTTIRRTSQSTFTSADAVEMATERLINSKCPLVKKDQRQAYTLYQGRPLNPARFA